jgi:hypothetical protein
MIRTIGEYAEEGGMDPERVTTIVSSIENGLADQAYTAVSPQFVVTAKV